MSKWAFCLVVLGLACSRTGISADIDGASSAPSCPAGAERGQRFWSVGGALGTGLNVQDCPGAACRYSAVLSFQGFLTVNNPAADPEVIGPVEEYVGSAGPVYVIQLDPPWVLAFGGANNWGDLREVGAKDLKISLPKRLLDGWEVRPFGLRRCTEQEPVAGAVGRLALSGSDGSQDWRDGSLTVLNWTTREALVSLGH